MENIIIIILYSQLKIGVNRATVYKVYAYELFGGCNLPTPIFMATLATSFSKRAHRIIRFVKTHTVFTINIGTYFNHGRIQGG